jgi:hypothetical protein
MALSAEYEQTVQDMHAIIDYLTLMPSIIRSVDVIGAAVRCLTLNLLSAIAANRSQGASLDEVCIGADNVTPRTPLAEGNGHAPNHEAPAIRQWSGAMYA